MGPKSSRGIRDRRGLISPTGALNPIGWHARIPKNRFCGSNPGIDEILEKGEFCDSYETNHGKLLGFTQHAVWAKATFARFQGYIGYGFD